LHPFVEGDRFTLPGDDGACPYFWPIGDRYILIFFSHLSGGQYLLGDYDTGRDKFTATAHGRFTFGASTPAAVQSPSVTPDGEGGLIVIFCMNRGKPAQGWDQLMTLPRRLTLSGKEDLAITPAGDIASLRHEHRSASAVKLPANREVVLEGIEGNALEIAAEIDDAGAPVVELCVLRSPGGEETTRIAFFRKRGFRYTQRFAPPPRHYSLITIDSSRSSTLPDAVCRAPETAPVLLEDDEPLRLRVFVDRSVVEVFVNGKQCVAARVYPGREDSVGVSLRAQGRDAQLMSLDAWQMKSTWQE
ncbi:MAG: glycoside hydrolase family 32 protein, partial [Lentisphaerae bacterium]|nr:glycoside hydrolase family 32 protein [Lentisphaerota bacterium]